MATISARVARNNEELIFKLVQLNHSTELEEDWGQNQGGKMVLGYARAVLGV